MAVRGSRSDTFDYVLVDPDRASASDLLAAMIKVKALRDRPPQERARGFVATADGPPVTPAQELALRRAVDRLRGEQEGMTNFGKGRKVIVAIESLLRER